MHQDAEQINELLRCDREYDLLVNDEEVGEIRISVALNEVCYDLSRSPNHYRFRITQGKPPYNDGGSLVLGLNFLNEGMTSFIHEPFYFHPFPCIEAACRKTRKASFKLI